LANNFFDNLVFHFSSPSKIIMFNFTLRIANSNVDIKWHFGYYMFHMDTNRLRQFCTIAETGSMTKASRLLHITHSGLSKSMKLLQEELGYVLLRPSGRGLALTEDGLNIYQRAKEFLEHEHRLFKIEKRAQQSTLRIGTVEIFLSSLAEQLKRHPFENSPITLLDLDPGHMEQLILNRQLDFGITYVPFPMQNLEITEIGKYRLGCYHLKNSFAGRHISEIPFVVPANALSGNPLEIKERDGWLESVYPRNRKYAVNLLSTALELTLQGLAAIYIPDFIAKKINASRRSQDHLVEYPLLKNQKNLQSVFLVRHQQQMENATYKQLRKMIKEIIL
jgi:DNA-binding transcriptional LysR family regulator